jgi:prepilin-type N-terminal cleavage/methylation domain-containing protein
VTCKQGFSLIELLVVLALIALLVSLVRIPAHSFTQTSGFTALNILCSHCMALQRKALKDHIDYTIEFDPIHNRYTLEGREYTLPSQVIFGHVPGSKGPPSAPEHPIETPITFQGNRIVFYKNGTIQSGTVYMLHTKTQRMYALSCPVASFSFLRRYRYDKKWHIY